MSNMIFLVVAVRKVAASHKLVTQGHTAVVEGWQLFEEAVEQAGPGDLPNLLWQLKGRQPQPRCHHPPIIAHGSWKYATPCFTCDNRAINFEQGPCYCYGGGLESRPALSATEYGDH